jgi:hypothetical protein
MLKRRPLDLSPINVSVVQCMRNVNSKLSVHDCVFTYGKWRRHVNLVIDGKSKVARSCEASWYFFGCILLYLCLRVHEHRNLSLLCNVKSSTLYTRFLA